MDYDLFVSLYRTPSKYTFIRMHEIDYMLGVVLSYGKVSINGLVVSYKGTLYGSAFEFKPGQPNVYLSELKISESVLFDLLEDAYQIGSSNV